MTFDFDVINAPITALHSFDFNCSSKLLIKRCFRVHRSISLNGPSDGCIELDKQLQRFSSETKLKFTLLRKYLEEHSQWSLSTIKLMIHNYELLDYQQLHVQIVSIDSSFLHPLSLITKTKSPSMVIIPRGKKTY